MVTIDDAAANMAAIAEHGLDGLEFDHVGIAVEDLAQASQPYHWLGIPQVHEDAVVMGQQVKVRTLQVGSVLLELLEPTSPDSAIAKFLHKRGAGLHHIALRVDDIAAQLQRLEAQGAQLIDHQPRSGRASTQVAFIHPRWMHGVLLELVQYPQKH